MGVLLFLAAVFVRSNWGVAVVAAISTLITVTLSYSARVEHAAFLGVGHPSRLQMLIGSLVGIVVLVIAGRAVRWGYFWFRGNASKPPT